MARRIDTRLLTGSVAVLAGAAGIAVALVGVGPARVNAAAATPVFLTIDLSDSAGGQYPSGGTVTVTATVSNPSSFTTTGTNVDGVTTTHTTSNAAFPTVSFSLSTSAVTFVSGAGSYTCSTISGIGSSVGCRNANSSASLTPGGTDLVPIVLRVVGGPAQPADVTGTVSGAGIEFNEAPASTTVATDTATVTNPGAYTNEAPAGCFPSKVGSDGVVDNAPVLAAAFRPRQVDGPQTFSFEDGAVTITVTVPPGALPNGTHLSLYSADPACWNPILGSSSLSFVDGYAVGWAFSGTTSFDASSSLSLSVTDSKAASGDPLFKTDRTGTSTQAGTAGSGTWAVSFTDDPGFVLAQAAAAPPTSSTTTTPPASSASGTTTVTVPSGGGAPVTRPASPVPLALGILAIVGGTALIGTRRRRRPE